LAQQFTLILSQAGSSKVKVKDYGHWMNNTQCSFTATDALN